MNNMNINEQLLNNFTEQYHKNLKRKKGIDWSKKNMYDGIGRPDLKEENDKWLEKLERVSGGI